MSNRSDSPESQHGSPLEPLYTISEVAALLRVSPATVARLISTGELRKLGFRRTIRIPASAVAAFVEGDETPRLRP
jgi:excisionase family DNA binding protein